VANWSLPIAAILDSQKTPEIISPNMTAGTKDTKETWALCGEVLTL